MDVTVHQWDGFVLSLYQLKTGEKIARHKHPFVHTTGVARGKTRVTMFYSDDPIKIEEFSMLPGDNDFAFPSNVEHEIEALEDDTIVANIHRLPNSGSSGAAGGLMMEDGTVVA